MSVSGAVDFSQRSTLELPITVTSWSSGAVWYARAVPDFGGFQRNFGQLHPRRGGVRAGDRRVVLVRGVVDVRVGGRCAGRGVDERTVGAEVPRASARSAPATTDSRPRSAAPARPGRRLRRSRTGCAPAGTARRPASPARTSSRSRTDPAAVVQSSRTPCWRRSTRPRPSTTSGAEPSARRRSTGTAPSARTPRDRTGRRDCRSAQ